MLCELTVRCGGWEGGQETQQGAGWTDYIIKRPLGKVSAFSGDTNTLTGNMCVQDRVGPFEEWKNRVPLNYNNDIIIVHNRAYVHTYTLRQALRKPLTHTA